MLVWGSYGQVLFSNLESIHIRGAEIIFNLDWCTPSKEVLATAKWNTLEHDKLYPSHESAGNVCWHQMIIASTVSKLLSTDM